MVPRFALAARGWSIMPWEESAQMHDNQAAANEFNIEKQLSSAISEDVITEAVVILTISTVLVSQLHYRLYILELLAGDTLVGAQRRGLPTLFGACGQADV